MNAADIRQHLVRLAEDADWPPGNLHLTDLTTIALASVPDAELLDLLYEGTTLGADLKLAVVVHLGSELIPDLRYVKATEVLAAVTFTDLESACEHLAIREDVVSATISELRHQLEGGN